MKAFDVDTGSTTLDGIKQPSESKDAPLGYRFYVLYTGSVGIVKAEPHAWTPSAPLGIGRRSASLSGEPWLHIPDERTSREHVLIHRKTNEILVEDLGGRNGSFINGTRVPSKGTQPLRDGDVLRVGDAFILFRHEREVADTPMPSIVGGSLGARQIRRAVVAAALSQSPALILGESGTGKEVAAQAIHHYSQRPGPLVALNCAAIPATLAEAQLFGVRKGAYTGAIEQPGAFFAAHKGTLFLDELGELPQELQPKLLRALETREVVPVGAVHGVPCDVRIIAATNRDLRAAMHKKTFREDLYARLACNVVSLPPLRERREDVLLLAAHFAGADFHPSPRLVAAMLAYSWPLNIRELKNALHRLQTSGEDAVIESLLSPALPISSQPWSHGDPVPTRDEVAALLESFRGNLLRIEREKGYSRRQFRRWVEEYELDLASYREKPAR